MKNVSEILFKNPFKVQCFGKDGELKWEREGLNGIVDEGLEALLDAYFNAGTQPANFYIGLIDNATFSAFSAADVMNSHAGWDEDTTYSEGTRPEWSPGAAATRAVTNATTVDFSINGTTAIYGIFVTTNSTKSGTTGVLWATAAFSSVASVENGDTLKVTYTVSG
jgi:hypothetical protein